MSDRRKSISPKKRLEIFMTQDGQCWVCKGKLLPKAWQVDHRQALVHGGDDAADNLRALCTDCHKEKTAKDVADNARVKRIVKAGVPGKPKMKRAWPAGRKIASRPFQKRKTP